MRKTIHIPTVLALAIIAATIATSPAAAGWRQRARRMQAACSMSMQPMTVQAVPMATPQAAAEPATTSPTMGDPYGFTAWLNGLRASAGLAPVAWDETLAACAASNSAAGFGHLIRCGRRQNSGWGADMGTICSMWLASPAHAAALLDPSITRIGVACVGMTWTFNGD